MRIVICPDKFRGTASASGAAQALAAGLLGPNQELVPVPLADGGEGTLDALGGANRVSLVTGPLGDPVEAEWRLSSGAAIIEMAQASGLLAAGGSAGNAGVYLARHHRRQVAYADAELREPSLLGSS